MKRAAPFLALALIAGAAACHKSGGSTTPPGPPPPAACDAGDVSFMRNASLAVLGRRPLGESEVAGWMVVMSNDGGASTSATLNTAGRMSVLSQMYSMPEFQDRWAEHLADMIRVQRVDDQSMQACWGNVDRQPDDGSLARYVRDHAATATGDGKGPFGMRDLVDSAIVADDVSPVYRSQLFDLVWFGEPAANVGPVQAELARRTDFGTSFDAAWLNRDLVCLQCHNSETSVTYDPDPAKNRWWPLPGKFERALYGQPTGEDADVAHAIFRYDSFADGTGAVHPWGWTGACGMFNYPVSSDDIAGIDGKFGNISGTRVSVFDVDASFKKGVDELAAHGLQLDAQGNIADADQAFAYLTAAMIVENVWRDVVGTPLTIANYFPRNQVSRDELQYLTDRFVRSHFSLKQVITDVVVSRWFNQKPPSASCGTANGYDLPNIYDPWVISDSDPQKRLNSTADAVAPLTSRVTLRAAYSALEWPIDSNAWLFPADSNEQTFDEGVGIYLKNGSRGFRGLDFQARLTWEDRAARCAKPGGVATDFLDGIETKATSQSASMRDVVVAAKDRILSTTVIDETSERPAIEAILGVSLDSPAASNGNLDVGLRRLCGVWVSSPQFLLSGFSDPTLHAEPALSP